MSIITLMVNGETVSADVTPRTHLADFLREERMLTGTHLGCEHGVCGACTLLMDGAPARSCIAFAVAAMAPMCARSKAWRTIRRSCNYAPRSRRSMHCNAAIARRACW